MQPRFEDLLNVPLDDKGRVAQVSPDNVLLYGASTMKWDEFKVILSPVSTIFLLPLVIGFSGPNSNDLVPYEVLDPLSFLDNHLLFPMGVFVLSTRIAGEIVLLYGGTILPMSPNAAPYYGLRDSEIGAEWIVPSPSAKTIPSADLDLSLLNVIIPSGNVKADLKALLLNTIPSLDVKVPGILFPSSSKNFYVHPDGIFAWYTYDSPRPSCQDEIESRFVLRNMRPGLFQYLMVTHNYITINPAAFMQRLIAVSLRSASEVHALCVSKNGIYHSEVRHFRIMVDGARQARFIRGDWLGSFCLDYISLYDFMPISHLGFDYTVSSRDTFTAFKNFIVYCTWVFGDHWSNSFMDEITKWQTHPPWTESLPWVIHLSLDKAIASWVLGCHMDASVFCYESIATSWDILEDYLDIYMSPEKI